MNTTTRQAQQFIRNGERPMAYMRFISPGDSLQHHLVKCMKLLCDMKCDSTHMKAPVWPKMVARAAPAIPHSNTKIIRGAATMLMATDSSADTMALRG